MIVSSTLPAAESFERLVFEEILPTIRRTGSYAVPSSGGVSAPIIEAFKRAKRDGWERDLTGKIKEAVDAKVTKSEVTKEVTKESAVSERLVIEANAKAIADVVLGQRENVQRLTYTIIKLILPLMVFVALVIWYFGQRRGE